MKKEQQILDMRYTILIFLSILLLVSVSCNFSAAFGDKNVKTQQRTASYFNKIHIDGSYELLIVQDSVCKLTLEADSNLLSIINSKVDDSVLYINSSKTIIRSEKLKIKVSSPNLKQIELFGSVELFSDSVLSYPELSLVVSGAAHVDMRLNTRKFSTAISGGSEMFLSGKSGSTKIGLTGAGRINAFNLITDTCLVNLSGIGRVDINANSVLEVNISGAGQVKYNGNAKVIKTVTGAGSVEKAY